MEAGRVDSDSAMSPVGDGMLIYALWDILVLYMGKKCKWGSPVCKLPPAPPFPFLAAYGHARTPVPRPRPGRLTYTYLGRPDPQVDASHDASPLQLHVGHTYYTLPLPPASPVTSIVKFFFWAAYRPVTRARASCAEYSYGFSAITSTTSDGSLSTCRLAWGRQRGDSRVGQRGRS